MNTPSPFSATDWLRAHTREGEFLQDDVLSCVASFTLMWNFFEGVLCEKSANVNRLAVVASTLEPARLTPESMQVFEDCHRFWTFRYTAPAGVNERFAALNFRSRERGDFVAEVLQGTRVEFQDRALAQMLIVLRLRNNLFHGLKTISSLKSQVPNLDTGCRSLATVLQASRAYVLSERNVRRA